MSDKRLKLAAALMRPSRTPRRQPHEIIPSNISADKMLEREMQLVPWEKSVGRNNRQTTGAGLTEKAEK